MVVKSEEFTKCLAMRRGIRGNVQLATRFTLINPINCRPSAALSIYPFCPTVLSQTFEKEGNMVALRINDVKKVRQRNEVMFEIANAINFVAAYIIILPNISF